MRTITLILITVIITTINTAAQVNSRVSGRSGETTFGQLTISELDSLFLGKLDERKTNKKVITSYGMHIGQFKTLSGFASNTEAAVFVKSKNKSFELGVFLDNNDRYISGMAFSHKVFILRKYFNENSIIEPYVNYNLIYRVTYLDAPLSMYPERAEMMSVGKSRYASMEHYLGTGVEINVFKFFYINSNAGFGRYIGSIKKPCDPDPNTGIYKGGNGWSGMFKVTLGFRIP